MNQPSEPDEMPPSEITQLTDAVNNLAKEASATRKNYRRLRWWVTLTVIGLCLDAALSVVAVLLYLRIQHVQTRTSNEVLCPLYRLLISFEERSVNSPLLSEQEKQQRRDAYVVIHQGYAALACQS